MNNLFEINTLKTQTVFKQFLTVKDIMLLMDIGQPAARKVREDVLKYCKNNKIYVVNSSIPCNALFATIGWSKDEYLQNLALEREMLS